MSESSGLREEWEEHNRSFRYEPPEEEPEYWSEEEYTELADRVIMNGSMGWECQQCTQPMGSLRKARRHVKSQHMDELLEKVADR